MEALLLRHNWFNHWPLVTELNAGMREVTLKFQDTNPVVGFPSNNQLPSFAVIQSHLINRKDTFILGNSKGFRSSVPRRVDKEYIVIIISHNITRSQLVLFSSSSLLSCSYCSNLCWTMFNTRHLIEDRVYDSCLHGIASLLQNSDK